MSDPLESHRIASEPYYLASRDEISLFESAYAHRLPLMLKGPTGCGKTRFVEYMAWRLGRPLVTISCNEDMSASDLVGRYLLDGGGTTWHDGPLTLAARYGAICYLDEVVEARQDTTVVIHPLADSRRALPLEKKGEVVVAHPAFQLVVSYNPGYQATSKDLKISTRQRFAAIDFHYPDGQHEARIVAHEAGIPETLAADLVIVAQKSRALTEYGLDEGVSTRMIVYAGRLISAGVSPRAACEMCMMHPLTDDPELALALRGIIESHFP